MFDKANEIFDETIFSGWDGRERLEMYNECDGNELHEELSEIIGEMIRAAEEAMQKVVDDRAEEFGLTVHQWYAAHVKWACAECADMYEPEAGPFLEEDGGDYVCPVCGCWTSAPEEDACYKIKS